MKTPANKSVFDRPEMPAPNGTDSYDNGEHDEFLASKAVAPKKEEQTEKTTQTDSTEGLAGEKC